MEAGWYDAGEEEEGHGEEEEGDNAEEEDMQDGGEYMNGGYEDEEADIDDPAPTVRKTRKKGTKGKRSKTKEDKCLCEAWKLVINDSIIASNQTYGRYWKRVETQFHETMWYCDYAKVPMDRKWNAMSHQWWVIQAKCNNFHDDLEQIQRRKESGKTVKDMLTDATMLFRENNDHKDFKFMHCFVKLQTYKKWEST